MVRGRARGPVQTVFYTERRDAIMTNTQQKEKPNFLYYTDWAEQLLSFPADLRLKIDDAVKRYVLYGEEPTDRDVLYSMFGLMRAQIDRDRAKYADVCNKNSENANKRWKNERMRSHTNGCNRMRSNAVDADNDNEIRNSLTRVKKVRTSRTKSQANARRLLLPRSKKLQTIFRRSKGQRTMRNVFTIISRLTAGKCPVNPR